MSRREPPSRNPRFQLLRRAWDARAFLYAHPAAVDKTRKQFLIKVGLAIFDDLERRIVFVVCHVSCLAASLASHKSLRSLSAAAGMGPVEPSGFNTAPAEPNTRS